MYGQVYTYERLRPNPTTQEGTQWTQFFLLFGTRTGFAILFAGGILLFAILAFVMEKRTHKMYVDRGPKDEDDQDSFWD